MPAADSPAQTTIRSFLADLGCSIVACHSWCRSLTHITGACVWPFAFLDRQAPATWRRGHRLATVAIKPGREREDSNVEHYYLVLTTSWSATRVTALGARAIATGRAFAASDLTGLSA